MNERRVSEITTAAVVTCSFTEPHFRPPGAVVLLTLTKHKAGKKKIHSELQAFGAYLGWTKSLWIGPLQGQLLGRLFRAVTQPRMLRGLCTW